MANKDILQYLRETPHNTNVNVVKKTNWFKEDRNGRDDI